jgi:hypothetical protein
MSAMYGAMAAESAKIAAETAEAERVENLKKFQQDSFKLGDLNPLIHSVDLVRKESVDAVKHTIVEKIQALGGLQPKILESALAVDPALKESGLRFVARFEVPHITPEQFTLLEHVVTESSDVSVYTRTDSKGNDVEMQNYQPLQPGEERKAKTGGWCMGPLPPPAGPLHTGLHVFKDMGQIDKNNFFQTTTELGKYIVEVREAGMQQMDLVTFVAQVATVLGRSELPDRGQLLYESYYDLMRLGLKQVGANSLYGMQEATSQIKRELLTPLASPELSRGIGEDPQSVLLVGIPGTGKTLIVESLLQEDTGVFIVPLDPFALQMELLLPKEKQKLMARVAEVGRLTGKRVVLHVDDIENMVNKNADTNSTLLNLMAGVQECGFYIIASTNHPEDINHQLIQPQRFSVLIHCGLQEEAARYEILKIHADMESRKLGLPLFPSEAACDMILTEVAKHTEGFTPRYLANIATIAKSHLMDRVAKAQQQTIGLTEQDLVGHSFRLEDWDRAFLEVASKCDSQEAIAEDKRMREHVTKNTRPKAGFATSEAGRRAFSTEAYNRFNAAVAQAVAQADISTT